MNATAPAAEPVTLDPVYVLRDEIAQSYPAVNGFERMLVLAAAQARLRYQEALNFERRVYQQTDPLELLSQSIDKFKTVLRFVADCERAWRRSLADVRSTSPAMLPPRGILLFQLPNRPLFLGIHHPVPRLFDHGLCRTLVPSKGVQAEFQAPRRRGTWICVT